MLIGVCVTINQRMVTKCQWRDNMEAGRIKNLRKKRGCTQGQLANYLGVAKRTYSNYENGKTRIPIKILIKLSDYYVTSVDYLIGLTDNSVAHERNRTI